VVDRSIVARHLLARFLRPYCKITSACDTTVEAQMRIGQGGISLVVLDAGLEGALPWLESIPAADARPAFVVVTQHPCRSEEALVSLRGAIGYLSKPISFQSLARALRGAVKSFEPGSARARAAPLAEAAIGDPTTGDAQVSCEVLNLSADGALLSTPAPIEIGTRLTLCLSLPTHALTVRARVVRVQEPGWGVSPGWGLVFEHDGREAPQAIERFVADCIARQSAPRPL
jgi:DNA-binding response OmpR family regulator